MPKSRALVDAEDHAIGILRSILDARDDLRAGRSPVGTPNLGRELWELLDDEERWHVTLVLAVWYSPIFGEKSADAT